MVEAEDNVIAAIKARQKGAQPLSTDGDGLISVAEKKFEDAMGTLKAYTESVQDVVGNLELKPKEVSVEIGLKLKGSVGFVIAKTGAETSMKVTLKWEPSSISAESADPAVSS